MPNVTVQILPDAVGATGFVLLTLEIGGQESKWVYLEDLTRGQCRPDPSKFTAYEMTCKSLTVNAKDESGTLRLLAEARARLR